MGLQSKKRGSRRGGVLQAEEEAAGKERGLQKYCRIGSHRGPAGTGTLPPELAAAPYLSNLSPSFSPETQLLSISEASGGHSRGSWLK